MRMRAGVLTAVVAALCAVATASPALAATRAPESGALVKASSTISTTVIHAERFDPATNVMLATVDKKITNPSSVTSTLGSMADPIAGGPVAAGVKLTAAGMRAKSGLATSGVKTAAAPGCCSASGGWFVTIQVTNGPSWASNYTFHSMLEFCWGGGTPGVHWGYVFACDSYPGSSAAPYATAWFTGLAAVEKNPRIQATNRYFYGWDQMNYSPNTAYYDWTQGGVDVCAAWCYYSHYPAITITGVANGGYYWATNAG